MDVKVLLVIVVMFVYVPAQGACDRSERVVDYVGKPFKVYVSENHWAEVVFPTPLQGMLDENPVGLMVEKSQGNSLPDRVYLRVKTNSYTGKILIHSQDGKSYHFFAVGRSCADSTVTVVNNLSKLSENSNTTNDTPKTQNSDQRRKLIEYMMTSTKPPGYRIESFTGPRHKRLIGSQGSVHFFVEEVYRGRNYSGVVMLAENHGRVPFKIALQAIDFLSVEIQEIFGRVFEVSMLPADFRLGPAPEYAIDIHGLKHQGLIFIVSKHVRLRRD